MSRRFLPVLGFTRLLALSIALFALLELAGWPLAILAGIIIGLMASRWRDAASAGALGGLIGWSLYLAAYSLMAAPALARALSLVGSFAAITLLLGLALGLLSSSTGYLAMSVLRQLLERRAQGAQAREGGSQAPAA